VVFDHLEVADAVEEALLALAAEVVAEQPLEHRLVCALLLRLGLVARRQFLYFEVWRADEEAERLHEQPLLREVGLREERNQQRAPLVRRVALQQLELEVPAQQRVEQQEGAAQRDAARQQLVVLVERHVARRGLRRREEAPAEVGEAVRPVALVQLDVGRGLPALVREPRRGVKVKGDGRRRRRRRRGDAQRVKRRARGVRRDSGLQHRRPVQQQRRRVVAPARLGVRAQQGELVPERQAAGGGDARPQRGVAAQLGGAVPRQRFLARGGAHHEREAQPHGARVGVLVVRGEREGGEQLSLLRPQRAVVRAGRGDLGRLGVHAVQQPEEEQVERGGERGGQQHAARRVDADQVVPRHAERAVPLVVVAPEQQRAAAATLLVPERARRRGQQRVQRAVVVLQQHRVREAPQQRAASL